MVPYGLLTMVAWAGVVGAGAAEPASRPAPTVAEMLGFAPGERLLIIHGDDAGMCHSANRGTIRAMTEGFVNSASIMVPCPWLPEIAEHCRRHPEADFGVHGTLTSEWGRYRWRPVLPHDQVPGLVDAEGYLFRDVLGAASNAGADEVERELRAQVRRAIAFGIRPTHLDTHMGTVFARLDFFRAYRTVANEFGLPYLLPRVRPARAAMLDALTRGVVSAIENEMSATREFTLDDLVSVGRDVPVDRQKQFYVDAIRGLKPGITQIIIHCGIDDAELQAISGTHRRRDMDTRVFTDPEVKKVIEDEGVRLITWREIGRRQRDRLGLHRQAATTPSP